MESKSFLWVDEQPIYLGKALQYLQATGRLDEFIGDILHQYILEQELTNRSEIAPSSAAIERVITDFRLQNQLNAPDQFNEWLSDQGMDYDAFRQQIAMNLQIEQLKVQVTQPKLQERFIERKLFLDQVVLSRIVVGDRDMAEELSHQISEGSRFEQLAQEYSITDDRIFNGMMGLISRGSLPDDIRAAIDSAQEGDVVGPLPLDVNWALFRIEKVLPASLDNPQVQQLLRDELLEEWIGEKLQRMEIEVRVDD